MQIEKTADAVFEAVKSYLEKRLKNLPAPRDGKDGVDGAPGQKGIDGAPGADGKPGIDGAQGLQGEKGMDGAPGEKGMDGAAGERGEQGPAGERGEKGEAGADGKDGAPGRDGIDGAKGMDGAQGERGADGVPGTKGMDGEPGRDGRDGPPGRDAAQIDILPSINESRSYGRGTWASHKGGLWRATRATEGMDGWECVVDGIADIEVLQSDERGFQVTVRRSSGSQHGKLFELPAMIYRGVFQEGEHYAAGDTVTWGGSLWHCNAATFEKPLDGSKSWQLAAKRGRDGKDGRNGIDLVKPVKLS